MATGDEYRLWQFHAHWGKDSERGAEHTIDGRNYAGEVRKEVISFLTRLIKQFFSCQIHFVHWNTKYGSPQAAVNEPDGLCVLGRFFEVMK